MSVYLANDGPFTIDFYKVAKGSARDGVICVVGDGLSVQKRGVNVYYPLPKGKWHEVPDAPAGFVTVNFEAGVSYSCNDGKLILTTDSDETNIPGIPKDDLVSRIRREETILWDNVRLPSVYRS